MRTRLALAGLGLGLAATLLPVTQADAACSLLWYSLFERCGPCNDVNDATGYLSDEYGTPPIALNCGIF